MRRRRRHGPDGPIRIENPLWVRFSVSTLLASVALGVVALLLVRRWVDYDVTVVTGVVIVVVLFAVFLSPEALVIDEDEVRDESGWRRTGWRILRSEVGSVGWEGDPELFEPPQLTFRDPEGTVLLRTPVEFDRQRVDEALLAKGWPLAPRS